MSGFDPSVSGSRRLSVLVPLYNEESFIGECLKRIRAAPLPASLELEIIVVDDGSTDGSVEAVQAVQSEAGAPILLIRHERNQGKGAAIKTALDHASGEFCIIQDADLEYSPKDYPKLLGPLLAGYADAVFGSRFVVTAERRVLYFWHSVANKLLTLVGNMLADINLTDMETCYKAFRTSLVRSIPLRSQGFEIEPELTIKLAQRRARIYETSISYYGRTYEDGKKIGLKDAFRAMFVVFHYALFRRDIYKAPGSELLDVVSHAPRFNRWMADTVRPFLGDRVLEIGAGIGNLSNLLYQQKKRYVASDVDPEHLAGMRAKAQHRRNFEALHLNLERSEDFVPHSGSFDSVVCLNVLEHIADDVQALSNIFHCLRPGGTAVVLVPEGMSVFGTLDEVLEHVRRYSEAELRSKLEQVGFRVERVLPFNRITRPAWYVNGRILKRRTLYRVPMFVFDRFVWLWRRIDRWLPWRPTSLIAVAIRPE